MHVKRGCALHVGGLALARRLIDQWGGPSDDTCDHVTIHSIAQGLGYVRPLSRRKSEGRPTWKETRTLVKPCLGKD